MAKKISITGQIRNALKRSSRSRYAISQECGVDQTALHRFVNGSGLRVESLEKLAEALGLEIVVRQRR